MHIGYSFWGFLGNGVRDTPDGGRSHRLTWVRALKRESHSITFLQKDRDQIEAGTDFCGEFVWDNGFPEIDVLFLEWRWPISGRNCNVSRSSPAYTPDLDRQSRLIEHYSLGRQTPTIIWDKDLQLSSDHWICRLPNVRIAQATATPRESAFSLLFPIADDWFRSVVEALPRSRFLPPLHDVVYIGNRYGRDDHFERFLVPLSETLRVDVYGKWENVSSWPKVTFRGRCGFSEVARIYGQSPVTLLLSPERYRRTGQVTQRIFEALLNQCMVVAPSDIKGISRYLPDRYIVDNAEEAALVCQNIIEMRRGGAIRSELVECLNRLRPMLATQQIANFREIASTILSPELSTAWRQPEMIDD